MPVLKNSKDSSIVKIAVSLRDQVPQRPQLIEFDQRQPLSSIIQYLCNGWELSNPDQYALQFTEKLKNYITERNRGDIKNGCVLQLTHSPSRAAKDILQHIVTPSNGLTQLHALEELAKRSSDVTFALEFINKQGLIQVISMIENSKFSIAESLGFALVSAMELMDHGITSWDMIQMPFISKVCSCITQSGSDIRAIQAALAILESLVLSHADRCSQVEQEVTIPVIVSHIQNKNPIIQQNTLALLNAICIKADGSKKKAVISTLGSRQVRDTILENIIQPGRGILGAEMAHQLYVLQSLLLNVLEDRMMVKLDPQDADIQEKIKDLRKIVFDMDADPSVHRGNDTIRSRQAAQIRELKKLGFKNHTNPTLDFSEVPPGLLALDCMTYFAKHHKDTFTKIIMENSCRSEQNECPFCGTSTELTRLMCEILRVGETPSEQGQGYLPLLFSHDHIFEEMFSVCIVLLNKTWREMRATLEDFTKVFGVVKEQILRALAFSPTNLDQFRQKLAALTYQEITQLWQQERSNREEWESQAKPIVELREMLTPETLELVQQQRLNFLVQGTRFMKYSNRGQRIKDKFWFARLSPNHKVIHYGDCDEKSSPSIEELPNKLPVIDIKALVVGKDCPHVKESKGRKISPNLAFSLLLDSVDVGSLDFVAPDDLVYDYWTDGVNTLLGQKMVSLHASSEMETLLSMEIKLRLLETEGIPIPQEPPEIPPEPDNYDFAFERK